MAAFDNPDEVLDAVWRILSRRVAERAAAAVDLLDELLHAQGRLHRRDSELVVGETVLNNDRVILPRLARATSLGMSIYLGNRRIASFSVLDAGSAHDVGGFADAILVDTVLRKREVYRGTLEVGGRPHLVACRPLFSTDDTDHYGALGMLEAFQDVGAYQDMLRGALRKALALDERRSTETQADRMESVMHFIDDVARRLQLLALNGNIIAAQAGDHGRAFRVVCRELSSLAEQSKDAVADVRRLTEDMGLAVGKPASSPGDAPANDAADANAGGATPAHAPDPVG